MIEKLLKQSKSCEKSSQAGSRLADAVQYKSVVNAEYKRNWVLEQIRQHPGEDETEEIEKIYRRLEEEDGNELF